MSSSLPQTATNSQSLNGIITLSDGVITIEDGVISGLTELDLTDIQVSGTATIENLVVNNQIDMTLGQIKNVAAPTDNGDATNKQFVDTNFLNKTTTTTQNVAGRVTFNSTTSGQSFPIIELINAITGSNNGMHLRFFKNFNRLPNTEIGSIVFGDKAATSNVTSRAVQLTASIDSASNPLLNITFDSGIFNPLTISNTQTILRNNDFYIKNKTTLENVFTYFNSTDKFTMYKPLDMNTTNKILNLSDPVSAQDASTKNYTDTQSANTNYLKRDGSLAMTGGLNMNSKLISNLSDPVSAQDASTKNYTDTHSNNANYLLRNGTLPMTGNLQMGSYKITNLLEPDQLNDGANKYYVDTQSANTHYLLRNGSLSMTGNLNLATHNLITTGDINCNDITADGNINTTADMSCADFNSAGNQVIGGSSSNVLDVKSSAFFEANVLIESNKHLAFYNSDLTNDSGIKMYFDSEVGSLGTFFMDMRGSEIRIRTDPSTAPTTERVKINNNETTINNNLICNGNVTLGNNTTSDTTTINSVATFNGVTTIDNNFLVNGNTTLGNFATGDTLTCNCQAKFPNTSKLTFEGGSILSFDPGAEIHGFRIKLKSVGTNYTISSGSDLTNDGILCTNLFPDNIIITMPARSYVWNNRKIIIKSQTGNVTIRQATGTFSTTRNNSTADYDITQDYLCKTHIFDSDFGTNGKIWSID